MIREDYYIGESYGDYGGYSRGSQAPRGFQEPRGRQEPRDANEPISVRELTNLIKGVVDRSFQSVRVVGEISNLSRPSSGHAYFTLKDEGSQIDVAVWRSTLARTDVPLANGVKIVCSGKVEVYAPHGKYKLIVSRLETVGAGALEIRFRQLESRLRREGLFDPARKKPLPRFIRRIGVATSPTSAAIHDFLNTLAKRSKRIDVFIAPVKVQGEGAAEEIASALDFMNRCASRLRLDAIALIRGGGSMEDLWSFNEEVAVRAVARSRLPIVTGIGHEIDVSLCDLAADVHALTPTAAATSIAPEDAVISARIDEWRARIERALDRRLSFERDRIEGLAARRIFHAPGEILYDRRAERIDDMEQRLGAGFDRTMFRKEAVFRELVGKLEALSPLAVLDRGYSLTKTLADGKLVRSPADAPEGTVIETLLANGVVRSVVVGPEIGEDE